MATKPGYTSTLAVSDAAETSVVAKSFCKGIVVTEQPNAAGWPRNFMIRGPMAGSAQNVVVKAGAYRFEGPFQPGDVAGTVELISAGGDSSTFNVSEVPA
jgi:hypothetical protein